MIVSILVVIIAFFVVVVVGASLFLILIVVSSELKDIVVVIVMVGSILNIAITDPGDEMRCSRSFPHASGASSIVQDHNRSRYL